MASITLHYITWIFVSSVGIEADGEKVALVVKELAGKNLEEVIAAGTEKLGSVPSGGTYFSHILSALDISLRRHYLHSTSLVRSGGAAAAAAPAAGGAAPAAAAAAAPPPKVRLFCPDMLFII